MKLLVGRLVLGCILAVLVIADDPVVVEVTENVKPEPEVVLTSTTTVVPETSMPQIKTRIFADSDRDNVIIPDHSGRAPHDHDHHHHDNHHHDNHHHDNNHHDNHHHRPPPPHPYPYPPPNQQPWYPPYYPPYYPPPYHYGPPMYAPVPPMQYYPQPGHYPGMGSMKPITTVIHTVPSTDGGGGGSGNSQKPTNSLWNLIDQKNNELWNLFGNKHGNSGGSGGGGSGHGNGHGHGNGNGNWGDDGFQEVVVINTKPGTFSPGMTTGSIGHTGPIITTGSTGSSSGWFNKGKNLVGDDCNNKKSE